MIMKLGTWIYMKYDDALWKIKKGINRVKVMLHWFPIIWKQQDWDYYFILELEYEKLKTMCKYWETHNYGNHVYGWYDYRNMKLCVELLDIILDKTQWWTIDWDGDWKFKDYDDSKYILSKYVNIRNYYRFYPKINRSTIYSKPNLYRTDLRVEKAWKLYCWIREYHLRNFWD